MLAPLITTDRMILRAFSLRDFDDYAAQWADERMTRFIGGEPRSRGVSWAKFTQAAGLWPILGYGYWAFIDRETGAFLGCGGLAQFERGIPEINGFAEAGWVFGPDYWGRGLASEAVAAILAWADGNGNIPEVRCIIAPDNRASVRVAQKSGFDHLCDVNSDLGALHVMQRMRGRP
jgi:RimJ/RimL family protein N-acetyltransferase